MKASSLQALANTITKQDWSPGIFKNNYRNLENFEQMTVIALDFDEGMSLLDASLKFASYKHIIATSRSHQKEKHGKVCDRFRVVLVLDRPIVSDSEYKATFFKLRESFPEADPRCQDASRFFYASPGIEFFSESGDDVAVQDALPQAVSKPVVEISAERKGLLARSTLEFVAVGAQPGQWNASLFKAAKDMQEQGLSIEEATELLTKPTGFLDGTDTQTIQSAFRKQPKHEPRSDPRLEKEQLSASSVEHGNTFNRVENRTTHDGKTPETLKSLALMDEALEHLKNPLAIRGISTGWGPIDNIIGGLRQSELGVVHAYPKSGKTVFITNLMTNLTEQGHKVAFASLEMHPAKQVEPDLYSILLNKNVREEEVNDTDRDKLRQLLNEGRGFTYYKRVGRPAIEDITGWIRHLYAAEGTRFFFIDHFHKIVNNEESLREIGRVITELTSIKYELPEASLILVVQPTKEGEIERRVSRKTLRGGAVIFDEVDWLINLHSKYFQEKIETVPWGEKKTKTLKDYPKTIRELEFDAIRAKPWSNNMGEKIYMEYDMNTTRMKPATYTPPGPEKIGEANRDEEGNFNNPSWLRKQAPNPFSRKRVD